MEPMPEVNVILEDSLGNYAGHSIFLPISESAYLRIRNQEIEEGEFKESDIVNYKTQLKPIFHAVSVYADCNENHF